jgi:hypothetical protein
MLPPTGICGRQSDSWVKATVSSAKQPDKEQKERKAGIEYLRMLQRQHMLSEENQQPGAERNSNTDDREVSFPHRNTLGALQSKDEQIKQQSEVAEPR